MPPNKKQIDALSKAEDDGLVCYACHLCELILEQEEDCITLLRYASSLTSLSRYTDAMDALDRADAIVPTNRRQHVIAHRGHLLEAQGDFSGAEKLYIQAHECDPDDATYLIYAASVAFQQGGVSRAEQLARKAVACPEGCIDEAYFNLGGYLIAQKLYPEAHECYRKALSIDPDYTKAKLRLEDIDLLMKSL